LSSKGGQGRSQPPESWYNFQHREILEEESSSSSIEISMTSPKNPMSALSRAVEESKEDMKPRKKRSSHYTKDRSNLLAVPTTRKKSSDHISFTMSQGTSKESSSKAAAKSNASKKKAVVARKFDRIAAQAVKKTATFN